AQPTSKSPLRRRFGLPASNGGAASLPASLPVEAPESPVGPGPDEPSLVGTEPPPSGIEPPPSSVAPFVKPSGFRTHAPNAHASVSAPATEITRAHGRIRRA